MALFCFLFRIFLCYVFVYAYCIPVVCPSFNSPNYNTFHSFENQIILHIKNSYKYSVSNRILLLVSQDIFIDEFYMLIWSPCWRK